MRSVAFLPRRVRSTFFFARLRSAVPKHAQQCSSGALCSWGFYSSTMQACYSNRITCSLASTDAFTPNGIMHLGVAWPMFTLQRTGSKGSTVSSTFSVRYIFLPRIYHSVIPLPFSYTWAPYCNLFLFSADVQKMVRISQQLPFFWESQIPFRKGSEIFIRQEKVRTLFNRLQETVHTCRGDPFDRFLFHQWLAGGKWWTSATDLLMQNGRLHLFLNLLKFLCVQHLYYPGRITNRNRTVRYVPGYYGCCSHNCMGSTADSGKNRSTCAYPLNL